MANNGKYGEALFAERMRALNYKVQDVSGNSDYWHKDIDFIATSPTTGLTKTFETKWDERINSTGNMYLEITNVHSKGGLGWFRFCQADYVAYGDAQAHCFYIVPLDVLKEAVERYKPRTAYCGQDSSGYLLPLKEIENYIMIL